MNKYDNNYLHSDITEKIIGQAYKVYNTLGYGFLEKVYENALCKKLEIKRRVFSENHINHIQSASKKI